MDECIKQKIGYKNPPLHSRWKKGQSGNPTGKKRRPKYSLEKLLMEPVEISENGMIVKRTAFEMILRRLDVMAFGGNRYARKLMRRFEALACRYTPEVQREFIVIGGLPRMLPEDLI
jgi:hypothetical protein